jgi:hypothetical protein
MAKPVREDYDNPGQFAQALKAWEAANPPENNVPPPKSGRGQFTAEQAAAIDAAAYSAAGYSGDAATADYIRQLQSGALGGGADTQAALNRLIEQGKAQCCSVAMKNFMLAMTQVVDQKKTKYL